MSHCDFGWREITIANYEIIVPRSHRRRWIIWTLVSAIACVAAGAAWSWPRDPFAAEIREACSRTGVDESLVRAIIARESGFNASKVHEGGYGLMQIGAGTGAEWAASRGIESFMATDLLDARTNTQAGCWYLARALARWQGTDDPVAFALADYAAGPEEIRKLNTKSAATLRPALKGTAAGVFVEDILRRTRKQ